MSIFKRWYDWVTDLGNNTGDYTQQVSTGLLRVWCTTANKYPNLTRFNPFGRGLLQSYCPLAEAPTPPPADGFTGGQCDGVEYICTGIYVNGNVNRGGCYDTKTWTSLPIVGGVTGLYFSSADGAAVNVENNLGQRVVCEDDETQTILRNSGRKCGYTTVSAPQAYAGFIKIVECHPADGSEDTCGDLFPTFPPDPPIDPSDFNGNITYTVYNNNNEPIYNDILNYQVNVENGDLIDLNIDLGGVNFNFGTNGIETTDAPDNVNPSDPDEKEPFNPDKYKREFPDDPDPDIDAIPVEKEEEEVEDEAINWVLIEVSTLPYGDKTILFSNPENNTFFAGYFSWTITTSRGTYRLEEIPIRKQKMAFKSPAQAIGYTFYTVNGAKMRATIFKRKVEAE